MPGADGQDEPAPAPREVRQTFWDNFWNGSSDLPPPRVSFVDVIELGLLVALMVWLGDDWAMVPSFYASFILATALHEAGHAVMARLLGERVKLVQVGSGPTVRLRLGSCKVRIGFAPGSGSTIVENRPRTRGRELAIVLAGPAVNVAGLILIPTVLADRMPSVWAASGMLMHGLAFIVGSGFVGGEESQPTDVQRVLAAIRRK